MCGREDNELYGSFDGACLLMAWNTKPGETTAQTLNRLFRKALGKVAPHLVHSRPILSAEKTEVSIAYWPKPAIAALAPEAKQDTDPRDGPRHWGTPVVIARYAGHDCLIDGETRGRAWRADGATDNYPVCLILVREP